MQEWRNWPNAAAEGLKLLVLPFWKTEVDCDMPFMGASLKLLIRCEKPKKLKSGDCAQGGISQADLNLGDLQPAIMRGNVAGPRNVTSRMQGNSAGIVAEVDRHLDLGFRASHH